MCQIQFIKAINRELSKEEREEFLRLMTLGSYNNKNAFGIFNNKFKVRTPKGFYQLSKEELNSVRLKIKDSNSSFFIGHNRLSTQGHRDKKINNHPFDSEGFILVHNGIVTNDKELKKEFKFSYLEETDSYIILALIEYFNKEHGSVLKAIEETTKLLIGSYSVFLFDKKTNSIYYFKNNKTEFYFSLLVRNKEKLILGSTKKENLEKVFLKKEMIFKLKDYELSIIEDARDNKVYLINDSEIKIIGSFKEREEPKYINYYGGNNWGYNPFASAYDNDLSQYTESLKGDYKAYKQNEKYVLKDFQTEAQEVLKLELKRTKEAFVSKKLNIEEINKTISFFPFTMIEDDRAYFYFDDIKEEYKYF